MASTHVTAFFVYGTLKRGHVREKAWPRQPQSVETGIIQAALYDVGPYPAIIDGHDWVAGELWHFDEIDIPAVTRSLDAVEEFVPGSASNLYDRRIVEVRTAIQPILAYAYFYCDTMIASRERRITERVDVLGESCCIWPDRLTRLE